MTPPLILNFMSGPRDGEVIALAVQGDPARVTLGRLATCSVSLPDDPDVSREHARLFWRDEAWWLEDLGSSNGSFLGEFAAARRLTSPARLSTGDIFRVGRTRFRVASPNQERTTDVARTVAGA